MSENKNDRVFCDGVWVREKKFDNGGSILKMSILASKFGAFVKKHKKDDGFINIVIAPKRNPDDKSSHMTYLDNWQPNSSNKPATPPKTKETPKKAEVSAAAEEDATSF